jgi:hypothetical protein
MGQSFWELIERFRAGPALIDARAQRMWQPRLQEHERRARTTRPDGHGRSRGQPRERRTEHTPSDGGCPPLLEQSRHGQPCMRSARLFTVPTGLSPAGLFFLFADPLYDCCAACEQRRRAWRLHHVHVDAHAELLEATARRARAGSASCACVMSECRTIRPEGRTSLPWQSHRECMVVRTCSSSIGPGLTYARFRVWADTSVRRSRMGAVQVRRGGVGSSMQVAWRGPRGGSPDRWQNRG